MENYIPPFDVTNKMLEKCFGIMEDLGKLSGINEMERFPRLRRVSRVKSIHSSLAIENNTLSIGQVTDIVKGKRVLAPPDDILAVKNAIEAYQMIDEVDPFRIEDLLKVHGVMMGGLVGEAGCFRTGNVGVFGEKGNVIHTAPSYKLVHELMDQLFDWIKDADVQMLIKSSVFHYEFEFIHPFRDGNGRIGRLWQTALLASWKPIFKYIPIESVIKDRQEEYYIAIAQSTSEAKSNAFILFMLDAIAAAIKGILKDSADHASHISVQINKLMKVVETYPQSAQMLMDRLGLKSRIGFRKYYLIPALEAGLVEMSIPDKPTSKNQMYYKK